jgi:hypothetical protein
MESERARIEGRQKREQQKLEAARIRGIRGRTRRPGFLSDASDDGSRSMLG